MNTNIKIFTKYFDTYKLCECEKKIIRNPNKQSFDDLIIYCELCDCPILTEDKDKIVDDWRHISIAKDESLWYLYDVLRKKKIIILLDNIIKI